MIIVTITGYLSLVEGNQKQRLTLPNDITEYINLKIIQVGCLMTTTGVVTHLPHIASDKVFIDGRTNILYPEPFFTLHLRRSR